jgi:hypothetical protein
VALHRAMETTAPSRGRGGVSGSAVITGALTAGPLELGRRGCGGTASRLSAAGRPVVAAGRPAGFGLAAPPGGRQPDVLTGRRSPRRRRG